MDGMVPGAVTALPVFALGDVVVPLPGTRWGGELVPGVPHVVVSVHSATAVSVVRRVVHRQLVAGELPVASYAAFVTVDRVRRAWDSDVDEAVRFRIGVGRVHEVVAGRTVCPESARKRKVPLRLEPTVDPVNCRRCLLVLIRAEAVTA